MAVNYQELKNSGFIRQKQEGYFCLRLKGVGGRYTTEQLDTIKNVANTFGNSYIHVTSRQGIEIPFIHLDNIETVKQTLAAGGVPIGECGKAVRSVTACHGNAICPSGIIDTSHIAAEIDKRFSKRKIPGKFKFGVTGCHNNCLRAESNDIGIKGGIRPNWNRENCVYCGLCQKICLGNAITVNKEAQNVTIDRYKCVYCGKCVKSCPKKSWQGDNGFVISFGGLYGNKIAIGEHILPIIFDEEELFKIIDAALNFFANNSKGGERFRSVIDRVGWETFQTNIKSALQNKSQD